MEPNKKLITEIKEKVLDQAKLTVAQLKELICYHFCSPLYKDTKFRGKYLAEVVQELF